jgi:hypothetical protein
MIGMLKGLFLLILLIVGLAAAYLAWLVLLPVSESDAEFRLSNVCYGGQYIASAVNGARHRPIACDCVHDGLVKSVGVPAMAKGMDVMRQMLVAQLWHAANGEKPSEPDQKMMMDRDALMFMTALHRLDRDCKISPFAARQ